VAFTLLAWSSAFVAIRHLGEGVPPGSLSLGRLVVAVIALGLMVRFTVPADRRRMPTKKEWPLIALGGISWIGIYNVALNEAERRIDAGTAAMIINTGPILIAVLAGLLLHEGFPPGLFAGIAVAFAGCATIAIATSESGSRATTGIALCILAALAYAAAVVVQKPALARVPAFQVTWIGCAAALVVCLPFAPTLVHEAPDAGGRALAWTLYLGLVPTALGFATWAVALGRTSAGRMASLTYLVPVVAILLGWAALGETPPLLAALGGALCLVGVVLARRRPAP
jgi:drug/metabolite transporter (DMT)-like permease